MDEITKSLKSFGEAIDQSVSNLASSTAKTAAAAAAALKPKASASASPEPPRGSATAKEDAEDVAAAREAAERRAEAVLAQLHAGYFGVAGGDEDEKERPRTPPPPPNSSSNNSRAGRAGVGSGRAAAAVAAAAAADDFDAVAHELSQLPDSFKPADVDAAVERLVGAVDVVGGRLKRAVLKEHARLLAGAACPTKSSER